MLLTDDKTLSIATLFTSPALLLRARIWVTTCIGTLLLACTISGAAPAPLDLTNLSLEDLMNVEVTTASKKPERLAKSPAAVFVIDSEDIYRYGYRTLSDALQSIIGFYTSTDRSYDYAGVRGYMRPSDYNTRILLLIDGHRINDPMYDMAPIGEDFPIDMESVNHIEVVKGPGSSLWGSNALLAVINVITRSGQDIAGGKVSASADKVFAEFGSANGKTEIACSITGVRSSGDKHLYFPEFDAPETNNGVAVDVDRTEASRGYISASYKNLMLLYNHGSRLKTIPTGTYGTVFNDARTRVSDNRSLLELSYESKGTSTNSRSLIARIFCDEYRYAGDYPYVYEEPPITINRDDFSSKWWGSEIRLSQPITRALGITYGAEYISAYHLFSSNYDVNPYISYTNDLSKRTTQSFYAQASYEPTNNLCITLGTRYDNTSYDEYSTSGKTWSPRAALIYSPWGGTSIKVLYGDAFRSPNIGEVASQDPSLPPLKPEKIETQELVWEQQLGNRGRLVTSLFRYNLDDIISSVPSGDQWGTLYSANKGSAKSSGMETQFETRTANGLRGYIGLCVTRASFNGSVSTNSPDYLITGGVSVPVLSNRYFISPQLRTIGRLITRSGQAIGAASVIDLVATTNASQNGTNVSLGIYDLLNTTTYVPAGDQFTQDKIQQAGRTLRLALSHRF